MKIFFSFVLFVGVILFLSARAIDYDFLMAEPASADTAVIRMGVVSGQMKYDLTEFTVKAGTPVDIVFTNNDVMVHNILILQPGSKDKVGGAADKMIADPKGMEKQYIPELKEILYSSPLVHPKGVFHLKFTAPETPGEYPYLCTFPGHWRIMQGMMKVE